MRMFIAALITKANLNACEQEIGQINWNSHTMKYYTDVK